jgi:SAM-dependent methyltransferase
MRIRIHIARSILKMAKFLQTLPVVVMKPADLIEFNRQSYSSLADVDGWCEDSLVDQGLDEDERRIFKSIPQNGGKLLVLGVGGGREAIQFAKMGFNVTGVDFIPAMIERAIENVAKRGFETEGLVQEISELDVPDNTFDVVWLSRSMYSSIPTRKRRVQMVQRIANALKPGGYFLVQFNGGIGQQNMHGERVRKMIAASPFGNRSYEAGDMLWLHVEFIHAFSSKDEIRLELEDGGLRVLKIEMDDKVFRCWAICQKEYSEEESKS